MRAILVECSDYSEIYGILTVEGVSAKEVQDKIDDIKDKLCDDECDDWCIEDVLELFPKEWKWYYEHDINMLEI